MIHGSDQAATPKPPDDVATPTPKRYRKEDVACAARGRWPEILVGLANFNPEHLDGNGRPCPICQDDTDRFNTATDFDTTGECHCRGCRIGGDGFNALMKANEWTFAKALQAVGKFLNVEPDAAGFSQTEDIVAAVCRAKRMPLEAFKQFGPTAEKRGRNRAACARVPVYSGSGEPHSHFDLMPKGKGLFNRGKGNSGMFFPGRIPQPGETWHIVEGVKDAAALVGLGLDAAGMPTSFLAEQYAGLFRGVDVVLVPDLDTAGQLGAQKSGGNLQGLAASVRVARLPGEFLANNGDDVRDVLARKDGEQLVRDAVAAPEPWQPRDGEPDIEDGRPEVLLSLNYGGKVDQVTKHLGSLGWQTPWIPTTKRERLKLFHRGGLLVHVVVEYTEKPLPGGVVVPNGTARIRPLPVGQLPLRIADACLLLKEVTTAEGIVQKAVPPPKWLIDGVATRGDYSSDVRRLDAIITAPTLRPDGTILQAAGYDAKTGLLHIPSDTFPAVPQNPTIDDARQAAATLLDVVADFEFVSDADRSAWVALVLSFIGRPAVAGCVPLSGVTATTRGSGKSLLVDAASQITYGRPAARKPFSGDDEEMRKAITATAIEALPAVMLDNVDRTLGGASLDAALTALTWSDRVLGASKTTGELPLRTIWTATGNNLRYGSDLARRVLPIRLAPSCENPEERTGFQHPDLLAWVQANRPTLAVAALTLLRAYFVAGRPVQPGGTWGSFDAWSALVRGAICWAGLADPLTTRETAKDDDTSGAIVRGLIGGLLELDEDGRGLTVREMVRLLDHAENSERYPTMREAVSEVATSRGTIDQRRLGYAFRKYRGRIANGWRLVGEPNRTGVVCWKAEPATAGDAGDAGHTSPDLYARDVCVSHIDTH
ncbi:MAG: hypothetical protein GY903_19155, partial [Fuerstiella sp.]|nr:hypothetical protein [Fuerstiella sp.]